MQEFEKAEGLYSRALDITERVLGPDHPQVADILENMARLYRRWADSKPFIHLSPWEKRARLYRRWADSKLFIHLSPWEKRDRARELDERAKKIRSQKNQ
jgi:hypothetical protein